MSTLNPDEILPVGSIMPFRPDEVPENWEVFNGHYLTREDFPDLWEAFRDERVREIFRQMGGVVSDPKLVIRLPYVDSARAQKLTFGASFEGFPTITLAIKAKRPSNGRDASERGEVYPDDSPEGQPGE